MVDIIYKRNNIYKVCEYEKQKMYEVILKTGEIKFFTSRITAKKFIDKNNDLIY
jgi:hypothetical protein